jgi:hypothetical protein
MSLERQIRSQKQIVIEGGARAIWGAGVLRPYMMLLGGESSIVPTAEILRFAQDDNPMNYMFR